jgi:hypothetical protein
MSEREIKITENEITIDGVPIKIVSEPEAELSDFVVCMPDTGPPYPPTAHNFGACRKCGTKIYWSNSSPIFPPKICAPCALELPVEHKPTGDKGNKPA